FKEDGKLWYEDTLEFLANERCIRVKTTHMRAGDGETRIRWHLLRPDGAYEIHPAQRPGEYVLKTSRLGEMTAPEAGYPFAWMTAPLMRRAAPMLSYVKRPETRVLAFGEAVKDGVKLKELKTEGRGNNTSAVSTHYFHATEEWLLHSV